MIQTAMMKDGADRLEATPVLYIAVIVTADGIKCTTVEWCAHSLQHRIAEYVRANAIRALWRKDAQLVLRLLSQGKLQHAIDSYFSLVGDRWDMEHLHIQAVTAD